jgi:hypothetical protein
MAEPAEKMIMGKELRDAFAQRGITLHYVYCRELIRACPKSVRQRYIKFTDAWDFWVLNPGWQPFSKKVENPKQLELGR